MCTCKCTTAKPRRPPSRVHTDRRDVEAGANPSRLACRCYEPSHSGRVSALPEIVRTGSNTYAPPYPALRSASLFRTSTGDAPHQVACDCVERGGGLRFVGEHEEEYMRPHDVTVDAGRLDGACACSRDDQP
eukprot:scaffold10615_cov106-Isochrysis_galbana.AAC.1